MQPNKIKLMIERARQKNSAPIAKRISGDGAFCRFNPFIFSWIYFAGCALIGGAAGFPKKRERSDRFFWDSKRRHLYIYKGTPCAHLPKKAVLLLIDRLLNCVKKACACHGRAYARTLVSDKHTPKCHLLFLGMFLKGFVALKKGKTTAFPFKNYSLISLKLSITNFMP